MDDASQQLFDLIALAGEHQAAVESALEGLAKERQALAEERQALARDRAALLDALKSGASESVAAAVRGALGGVGQVVAEDVRLAQVPLVGHLKEATTDATRAVDKLRRVAFWLSWPYVGSAALLISVILVVTWGLGWWQNRHEREALKPFEERRDELLAETAKLEARVEELETYGGRLRVGPCPPRPGEKRNLECVIVEKQYGAFGPEKDYYVPLRY
jgi:hypothetical protein